MAVTRLFGGRGGEGGLFGVKKGQFGRTHSPHGRKSRTQFHKLVFDPGTGRARTARRFTTLWK